MDDGALLGALNEQFIDAVRRGSWDRLAPVLDPSFRYLDGATGEVWPHERYVETLERSHEPRLTMDELVIHVAGDAAVVSARTSRTRGTYSRYIDTYRRGEEGWKCLHACIWPLARVQR